MQIAWFTTVCGEATTTAGIFTEKDLIDKEYRRFKEQFESEEGNRVLSCEIMDVQKGVPFEWGGSNRILIDILLDSEYFIDWGYDAPRSNELQSGRIGDLLMVDLSTINEDEIGFIYMVKNKFVYASDASGYLTQKRLINEAIVMLRDK